MKKSMTAEEFKLYWKQEDFVRILYLSENQEWYWTEEPCKMTMVFQEIEILENQNKIFLKSDGSTLVFSMVKEIKIDTGCQGLDTAISICCGAEQEEMERVYTLEGGTAIVPGSPELTRRDRLYEQRNTRQ